MRHGFLCMAFYVWESYSSLPMSHIRISLADILKMLAGWVQYKPSVQTPPNPLCCDLCLKNQVGPIIPILHIVVQKANNQSMGKPNNGNGGNNSKSGIQDVWLWKRKHITDNHKLQTNPWHREEEQHNNHETARRQPKQRNQLSIPHQDDCKLEWT